MTVRTKKSIHRKSTKFSKESPLSVVNPESAGIDIGGAEHYVAVPADRDPNPVQVFGCFTHDLKMMTIWLKKCGIKSIAMESTGTYWIPVFEALEDAGFEVFLVDARQVKNVPGRKTDVSDCQWIQQLHSMGLLRAAFVPPTKIVEMRSYVRQRTRWIESSARQIQHMQKALGKMNVQLHKVVSWT